MNTTAGREPSKPRSASRVHPWVKAAFTGLLFAALFYGGYLGRRFARVQVAIEEVIPTADQLWDASTAARTAPASLAVFRAPNLPSSAAASTNAEIASILTTLQSQFPVFNSDPTLRKLSAAQALELRVARATADYAQQRSNDILANLTAADENLVHPDLARQRRLRSRVQLLRAEALFAQRNWVGALEAYQRIRAADPGNAVALAGIADCQFTLHDETAAETYRALAVARFNHARSSLLKSSFETAVRDCSAALAISAGLLHSGATNSNTALSPAAIRLTRGDALLLGGSPSAAANDYQEVLQAQPQSGNQQIAAILCRLGNASLLQGQLESAREFYDRSIDTFSTSQTELAPLALLASAHLNRGSTQLAQQKLDSAARDFEKAAAFLERSSGGSSAETACDLATALNNTAIVRRLQRDSPAAIATLDKAVQLLSREISPEPSQRVNPPPDSTPEPKLDVLMILSERAMDVVTRARIANQNPEEALDTALAIILRNRAATRLGPDPLLAAADLSQAVSLFAALVEGQGRKDLASQFARTLTAAAWLLSTHPSQPVRDGNLARQYARKACDLTGWKLPVALEAFAAASAEAGNFTDAARWQQTAAELSPLAQRSEALAKLELYRAARPFRSSPVSPP